VDALRLIQLSFFFSGNFFPPVIWEEEFKNVCGCKESGRASFFFKFRWNTCTPDTFEVPEVFFGSAVTVSPPPRCQAFLLFGEKWSPRKNYGNEQLYPSSPCISNSRSVSGRLPLHHTDCLGPSLFHFCIRGFFSPSSISLSPLFSQ